MASSLPLNITLHNEILHSNENFVKVGMKNKYVKIKEIQDDSKHKDLFNISNKMTKQISEIKETEDIILNKFTFNSISKAKILVQEATKNNLIFCIYGPYEHLRCLLRKRGWIEKQKEKTSNSIILKSNFLEKDLIPNQHAKHLGLKIVIPNNEDIEKNAENENEDSTLYKIASQLVSDCTADFIWSLKMSQIDMHAVKPNQLINHFQKSGSFTTKIGLIKSFNYLRWFEKNPDDVFPRSYIISDEHEKKAFLNDYYLTACLSLVRLTCQSKNNVSKSYEMENINHEEMKLDTNNSTCYFQKVKPIINFDNKESIHSLNVIDRRYPEMAVHYCQLYLKNLTNKDLDTKEIVFCSSKRWEDFFSNLWNVAFEGYSIQSTDSIMNQCKDLCNQFEKVYRQFNLNGTKNIWIVKPGAKSRGRGISCLTKFSELNNLIQQRSEILIVQKYIERPLLVYNTKFDIRQWFLVTSWSPLTIWWYKDSYIRFCSQQFTLYDFNEAVHLSNNSIQHKYENGIRSKLLPESNMWTWESLEKYLNEHGYFDGWKKSILPAMKRIIIDILLCSQEEIEDRKNSFELYGADFMVTECDLKTWLLEINSSPCLAPSTDVTARLTKSVLEDLLKVVLDYPKNMYCETGQFELLYLQSPFLKSTIDSQNDLSIIGSSLKKPISYSFITSHEKGKQNQRFFDNTNRCLNNKLRYVIHSDPLKVKMSKTCNSDKKIQYRECITSAEDGKSLEVIRNSKHDSINEHSYSEFQYIKKHTKFSQYQIVNSMSSNSKILPFRRKFSLDKNNHQENSFPVIKLDIEKSECKKRIFDRYSKIRNYCERTVTNKSDILRTSEPNVHNDA